GLSDADQRSREPLLSTVAGFVLLGALLYLLNRTYDVRTLDTLLQRLDAAVKQESITEVRNALGEDEDQFFDHFARAVNGTRAARGGEQREAPEKDNNTSRKDWVGKRTRAPRGGGLEQLYKEGGGVRDSNSNLQPHGPSLEQLPPRSSPPADLI